MFGFSNNKRSSYSPVLEPSYDDIFRERRERMKAECRADDAEAKARALSYAPPVKVLRGEAGRFLEIGSFDGSTVMVPAAFIAGVKLNPIDRQYWRQESARLRVSIAMTSGFEQSIWVEKACAEMLLAAIHQAWTGGE